MSIGMLDTDQRCTNVDFENFQVKTSCTTIPGTEPIGSFSAEDNDNPHIFLETAKEGGRAGRRELDD